VDLRDSPEAAAFRKEARAFLDEHAPREPINTYRADVDEEIAIERSTRWQRTLYEHGWAAITWPRDAGGRGLGPVEQIIWNQELARAGVTQSLFMVGVGMVGPTLLVHGTPEQQARHLDPILSGDHVWCQLLSEPGAGSDLAGLHTRALRDGDEWVVNGQKVWSSGAHYSHYGILLARTNPDVPKHQGLTCFACPMDVAGVECRPLRQMTGGAHFNEVFLTDARIPDSHRIGDVDRGWDVARTLLANERMALSGAEGAFSFDELVDAVRTRREALDPVTRDLIARLYVEVRTLDFLNARVITKLGRGETPTAEASIMKIKLAGIVTDGATLTLALLGAGGMLDDGDGAARRFVAWPAMHIGGGTDEVNKNIVAERVLGLPRDPA
jgi:alkylation response protein AidB-like acyl-CoA dehydrogenase